MFSRKTKKEAVIEEEVYVAQEPVVRKSSHKEHVFGAFLFGGLIIVVLAGLAGIGFGTYSLWQQQVKQSAAPSISALATTESTPEEVTESSEEKVTETKETSSSQAEVSNEEALKKAQTLDIIVMNGGGAKGVASEAATKLKEAGFTKTTIGNTTGDFTGTTVYTKKELEAEGKEVLAKLKTAYPAITYKESLASDKETQTASITVIFGK